MSSKKPIYSRILLKLSGEMLAGDQGKGVDIAILKKVSKEIKSIHELGVEVAIVIGGGNIFRGMAAAASGMERVQADYVGMLATSLNALALQDCLEKEGLITRIQSAIEMQEVAEPYIKRRATRHLEKKRIVLFSAGTGNPFFTTDTAAALRACEIGANVLLKATKVDGVYDKDPIKHKDAKLVQTLDYIDVINKKIKVMDPTAITLCMEQSLPILVFGMKKEGTIRGIITGEALGTLVSSKKEERRG